MICRICHEFQILSLILIMFHYASSISIDFSLPDIVKMFSDDFWCSMFFKEKFAARYNDLRSYTGRSQDFKMLIVLFSF